MSYSIIFETKMVKLSDDKILWLSREGCNNDDAGRKRDEFFAQIKTREEITAYARSFMENSKPIKESDGFDLKIGSRYVTWHDYGTHLLRMLNRAEDYSRFVLKRYVRGYYIRSFDIIKPVTKTLSPEEFDKVYHEYRRSEGEFSYCRNYNYVVAQPNNEKEVISEILKHKDMNFYVGTTK